MPSMGGAGGFEGFMAFIQCTDAVYQLTCSSSSDATSSSPHPVLLSGKREKNP